MERKGVSSDCYEFTREMLSDLENFLYKISFDMEGDIDFDKLNLSSIIKAIGARFSDEYDNLGEKIIDYMELVRAYDGDKIFFTFNIRDYINDSDMGLFINTTLSHNLKVFMIECRERKLLYNEIRYIVDHDLCEIC